MGKHIIIERRISAEEHARRQAALTWRIITAFFCGFCLAAAVILYRAYIL